MTKHRGKQKRKYFAASMKPKGKAANKRKRSYMYWKCLALKLEKKKLDNLIKQGVKR